MEVDDAIVNKAEPVDEKTVLAAGEGGDDDIDDSEQQQTTPSASTSSSSSKQKRAKIKHDTEEPPGALDPQNNDSVLTATPFKLEVSGSEDEREDMEDGDGTCKVAIRRKLLSTPMEEDTAAMDGLEELEEVAIKRKRYEVRRSGSEECLLGFDELSGEAELVKAEVGEESVVPTEEQPTDNLEEPSKNTETANETKESPLNSPKSSKKASPLSKISSPGLQATRSASKSPKAIKPKTPPLETDHQMKTAQKSPPKPHIVADGEETNGMTPVKTNPPAKKTLSPQDEFYKKPFEYGWKRELVFRANPEQSKDKADVYFISPAGKKLRARSEIIPLLEGDLTIDHFCFTREPLGAAPEVEIVRSAKPTSRPSVTAAKLPAVSTPPSMGKRVSKPKGPKGASPPPQGWTPSKALKVNNAALLSSRVSTAHHTVPSTPPSSRKHDNAHTNAAHSGKTSKAKKSANTNKAEVAQTPEVKKTTSNVDPKEPCTVNCPKAQGQVPQLQCTKCLCLHHHECVGLSQYNSEYRTINNSRGKDYICEACCVPKTPSENISTAASLVPPAVLVKPSANIVNNNKRPENKFPQTIAVVKGKKYVMVAKPLALPNEHVNDIENDLKQINESIRKNRKQSNNSLDGSTQAHNSHNSVVVDNSNKLFATNFFANVSYAYDSLLCILKYLKIHERPRAAAVCKLWNLAAKDTSLWQTVRMKNSKVCSWSGFAGALRRGETKHLDLRKMLLSSVRSEDMWNDFCANIGTVCSLETIDLCRCSARVVESLFQSNRNLKVINALAINDDTINLEHISLLHSLEELRLRTCEAGVLAGDLTPMASLSQITHLSLTSIKGLGAKNVEVLGELTTLKSLELGECGDFDSTFAEAVLPKLINLQRLRLENSQVTNVCTLEILDAVARLEQLYQLELVNFDIKPGFDEKLSLCTNISKLLIIPTYISQSATTNQIVLSAVQQVSESLKVFTWCVTVELLRVTALYVDQCEESTKKEKHHFDECIPVLKPVPGATNGDEDDEENGKAKSPAATIDDSAAATDVPQIEILPLDKVESILAENLPHTKFTIVKVPYHATCKQQLVELN